MRPAAPNRLRWFVLFFGLAPALVTATDAIPPEKAEITLTPKFGPVTFAHQRHSDLEGVRCVTCHHTLRTKDEPVRSCYSLPPGQVFQHRQYQESRARFGERR